MKSSLGDRIKTTVGVLLLLAAVGWFFAPLLLDERIVVERDALSSILPMRAFLARALADGVWPTWNPEPVLGKPFLGEWQSGLLYPPSLLLLVQPFSRGFNLLFVFHYAWTALGALLALRALGLPRIPSLLGAVVWVLGGPMLSLGHLFNHLMGISWLPWIVWAYVWPRRASVRVMASALVGAIALMTGSPEMVALGFGALLLVAREPRALLVAPLAALLAAVQLVPVWRYLGETHRGLHGLGPSDVLRFSASFAQIGRFASPAIPLGEAPLLPSVYVGSAVLLLALLGWASAPRRARRTSLLAALLLIVFALGAATPILPWLLERVPALSLLRYPEKLLLGVHALIAAGAAYGCARLCEFPSRRPLIARRRGARRARRAGSMHRWAWLRPLLAIPILALVFFDLTRVGRGLLFAVPPEEILSPPPLAQVIERSGAAAAQSGAPTRYYANPTGAPRPGDARATAQLERALLIGGVGELYGLANVNQPESLNLEAHERLQRLLGRLPHDQALTLLASLDTSWVTSWQELRAGSVAREVAAFPLVDAPATESAGAPRLYRLDGGQPRAFIAPRIAAAQSPDAALARLADDLASGGRGLAVVEGGVAPGRKGRGLSSLGSDALDGDVWTTCGDAIAGQDDAFGQSVVELSPRRCGEVRWIAYGPDALALEVDLETPGLLVISETYADGWTATARGATAPIVRVNGLVRGIWLDAGHHRVELVYRAPGLIEGAALSALGFLLCALLAIRWSPSWAPARARRGSHYGPRLAGLRPARTPRYAMW